MTYTKLSIFIVSTACIGSIWLHTSKPSVTPLSSSKLPEGVSPQNSVSNLTNKKTNSLHSKNTATYPINKKTQHNETNPPVTAALPVLSVTKIEKNTITNTAILFQGNSDYTDDDTEDNDAGNAGFEDDHPENNISHGSDFAEAYSDYSESYKGD